MLPRVTTQNVTDVRLRDVELRGEIVLGNAACCIKTTEFSDLSFVQFVQSVFHATRSSALLRTVSSVFSLSPEEKVRYSIDTEWVVAPMANTQTIGNLSVVKHPTQTMDWVFHPVDDHSAIAIHGLVSCPEPALLWSSFVYSRPKQRLGFLADLWQKVASRFRMHVRDWLGALRLRLTAERPGFFIKSGWKLKLFLPFFVILALSGCSQLNSVHDPIDEALGTMIQGELTR